MHYLTEHNILIFLIQILLLLGCARVLGEIFRLFKQPPLTAEILTGLVFGPTILGRFFPAVQQTIFPPDPFQQGMLETVAWLGVFFLLLEAGLEIDFTSAWRQRADAARIAVVGIIVPVVLSFFIFLYLPDSYLIQPQQKIIFALFMGVVLAISAMPVVTRVLYDLNLLKTDLAFLILSALSVNDIIGWLLLTLVLVFFKTGTFAFDRIAVLLCFTLTFVGVSLTFGRLLTDKMISWINKRQMPEPGTSLTFICLVGLFCGAITQAIGTHALFGFFIAGMMTGGSRALSERTRQVISQMVFAIFVPLFFANIGLHIDFVTNFDLFLVFLFTLLGIGGKFLGGWLGARMVKQSPSDSLAIAIAHTPGGMMEIVVGMLALDIGLINERIFVAIIFAAIFASIAMGPWFSFSINRRKQISILEYFSKRAIVTELRDNDRDLAITELCEMASGLPNMPSAFILTENVIKREQNMGTALENGVAVPHARLPFLRSPQIVFGRSIPGIEWNSPDGKPTHFIFLILTPEGKDEGQVQILRAIASLMSDGGLMDELMTVEDQENLWQILQQKLSSQIINK